MSKQAEIGALPCIAGFGLLGLGVVMLKKAEKSDGDVAGGIISSLERAHAFKRSVGTVVQLLRR